MNLYRKVEYILFLIPSIESSSCCDYDYDDLFVAGVFSEFFFCTNTDDMIMTMVVIIMMANIFIR